jgi:uncharacterized protein (TIGR02147 family)
VTKADAKPRPLPWEFSDHRAYLAAMIEHLRATKRGFSLRQFSRKAGFASPNYLKLVAEGKKNLTSDSTAKFARALGLKTREREAFEALVLLDQASTDEQRSSHFERLKRLGAKTSSAALLEQEQFEIYASWYTLPIKEMVGLEDFREDPEWIAARLFPRIRPKQAARALELLEKVGLLVRDDEGRLQQRDVKLATAPSVQSLAFRNYHRAMLRLSVDALEKIDRSERKVSWVTIGLTPSQYERMCERIEEFRLELLDLIEDERPSDSQNKEIHVLGFELIPVTRRASNEE